MKIYINFNSSKMANMVLQHVMSKHQLTFKTDGYGEITITEKLTDAKVIQLEQDLEHWGINLIQNHKSILVQRIKDTIIETINAEEEINVKFSVYLAEKLNHSYGYLANLFSEVTYSSIENFIILQKIEHAKQLILTENYTLTEIAHNLNYSSVAHLSGQFKKVTGITPSVFQRIIKKRKELVN